MVSLLTHICVTRPQWVNVRDFLCDIKFSACTMQKNLSICLICNMDQIQFCIWNIPTYFSLLHRKLIFLIYNTDQIQFWIWNIPTYSSLFHSKFIFFVCNMDQIQFWIWNVPTYSSLFHRKCIFFICNMDQIQYCIWIIPTCHSLFHGKSIFIASIFLGGLGHPQRGLAYHIGKENCIWRYPTPDYIQFVDVS